MQICLCHRQEPKYNRASAQSLLLRSHGYSRSYSCLHAVPHSNILEVLLLPPLHTSFPYSLSPILSSFPYNSSLFSLLHFFPLYCIYSLHFLIIPQFLFTPFLLPIPYTLFTFPYNSSLTISMFVPFTFPHLF